MIYSALALCAGKSDPNACNLNEGYVKYKDGRIVQNSGGTCVGANTCANCNEGYYPDSGSCRFCRIDHCNIPRCTNANDAICEYCEGEYASQYGTYAYTRFRDGGRTCRQACSWRKGSRCFPGNCSDTTIASCKCLDGFTGPDCDQIIHAASIQVIQLKLFAGSEIVESPPNISNSDVQPVTWTNLKSSNMRANVTLKGHFMTEFENYTSPKYIINSTVGISYGKVQLDLHRAGSVVNTSYIQECNPGTDDPTPDNFACEGTFMLNDWQPLKHQDRIEFTVAVRNGGHVLFVNYDNYLQEEKYILTGVTKQNSYSIVFDYQKPVQCREFVSNCSSEPLTVPDVINNPFMQVSWDEWYDNDSGILKYVIEVFHLIPEYTVSDLTQLKHGDKVSGTSGLLNSSVSKANITLRTPGAYSVLLVVFDKAGNTKSTRRIFIFDNISTVEKMNNPFKVTSASEETSFRWINKQCKMVHVEWHSHFANKAHESNGWLNSVEKLYQVASVLDDYQGKRQISRTENIHGIVRFDVGYETIYQGHMTHVPFKTIQNIHNESADIIEDIVDGKRMVIHVRAYDIMDNFAEDNINVTIDTSPPVIENLRFTWGDGANISMSRLGEFANLTIEWLAYDTHSGINYIKWRLYDNYTGHTVVRGLNNLSLQQELSDKEKCQAKYINYSRGDHCYCTPFDGCYHKQTVLKSRRSPGLNEHKRGLENTDQVRNGVYIFEVEVENKAKLKTTVTLKTAGPFVVYSTSPEFSIESNVTVVDDHLTSDETKESD
ncbi:hypothetical protein ACJMK2_039789 [Sinanodonta woodiana]|uniref:EGF-like domain-containing protein n=1 Tax=Sinanodonta woodiana TaxID=1069815 RepID=A0ABD3WD31_SINWO